MMAAFGPDEIKERFIAFDTICDATQVSDEGMDLMCDRARLVCSAGWGERGGVWGGCGK